MPNQRPPTSVHHKNAGLSDLSINGTHNLRTHPPWKRVALEKRTPNNTHPRSRRTAPQESATIQPSKGGMSKPQKVRQPKNAPSPLSPHHLPFLPSHPHADKTNHPTALKHSVGKRHRRCILKPIHVRALTKRTSHNHGTFGVATCTLSRQPNTWIDFK